MIHQVRFVVKLVVKLGVQTCAPLFKLVVNGRSNVCSISKKCCQGSCVLPCFELVVKIVFKRGVQTCAIFSSLVCLHVHSCRRNEDEVGGRRRKCEEVGRGRKNREEVGGSTWNWEEA